MSKGSRSSTSMYSRFWLVIAFLTSRIRTNKVSGQCHTAEYSVRGMYLRGHTFKNVQVELPETCYFKCTEEVTCQSYNFVIGLNICELNNRTKEARPEDFLPDEMRYYMKRLTNRVPLGSIAELPAESCTEVRASEGNDVENKKHWIYSDEKSLPIEALCEGSWQKVNGEYSICFGAKDNQYGSVTIPKSGRLRAMKLIRKSGSVRCNHVTGSSFWGCTYRAYNGTLSTIITDADKNAVLPPDEDLEGFDVSQSHECGTEKHFYSLDGTSHNSTVLVFRNLSNPLSVSRDQELQIWYGQDLKDCSERGNSGKTCVDVFAWYE